MSNEFEVYCIEGKSSEFSAWEFHVPVDAEQSAVITVEEALIDERALLKQQAFEEGYAAGMQQAQEDILAHKAQLVSWIELLQKPVQLLDDQLIQDIIQTMIWICKYCIGVELSVNPNLLISLFEEIKEELPSLKMNQTFGMHPDDIEWIKAELGEKVIPGLHDILYADASLARGDFYLKGDNSELDGRLQTRLFTLLGKYIKKEQLVTPTTSQD